MTNNCLDEMSCRILGTAIVAQACEDYVNAQRALKKPNISEKLKRRSQKDITECLEFFDSAWFEKLSRGVFDHDALISRLNHIVDDPTVKVVKFR